MRVPTGVCWSAEIARRRQRRGLVTLGAQQPAILRLGYVALLLLVGLGWDDAACGVSVQHSLPDQLFEEGFQCVRLAITGACPASHSGRASPYIAFQVRWSHSYYQQNTQRSRSVRESCRSRIYSHLMCNARLRDGIPMVWRCASVWARDFLMLSRAMIVSQQVYGLIFAKVHTSLAIFDINMT